MDDPPVRVLLVEDNPDDAYLLRDALRKAPHDAFQVVHVGLLAEALRSLASDAYDVVLLDLDLPDSHANDSFYKIHSARAHVPVVILTGLGDDAMAVEMVRLGAQDYLPKDEVTPPLLARCIRYAIERAKLTNHLRTALDQIQLLHGLLPVCSGCGKVRTDEGYWQEVGTYVREKLGEGCTHGLCPGCLQRLYPGLSSDVLDSLDEGDKRPTA
jgi:CheY-like chemotaxis protein